MPPQAPQLPQIPARPGVPAAALMNYLRARATAGAPGPLPNSLPANPVMPLPAATPSSGPQVAGRPQATPTQQVMKAAAQAQSPLMNMETRNIAKTLVQKLLQHM